ncbi:MAG: phosphoenolpyruvate--protein phosphotransferase, partial [Lachnospiraceae bacterium]|nr:phosphoenolpyruvate--protein phosphotransferase [Lachnospiraceae bacterium]
RDKTNRIKIYANICGMNCVNEALKYDPDGIGLFRTEYLFMNASKPGEEEQFEVYKSILEKMNPRPVIIRTIDLGADKNAPYLNLEAEDNPAMGLRGIRLCLNKPKLFKTQLRALLRAGVYGNLSVMFPMITSVNEVKKIKAITEEIKAKLTKENIPFAENIRFGVMIETPAAVMVADELAKEADFFSIGTNDLTQYTLAMDRTNPSLEEFYDTHSPAVLKMIKMTAKAAKENNIPVGICGELAADTSLTEEFIDMGIDELSVAIPQIAEMKKKQ